MTTTTTIKTREKFSADWVMGGTAAVVAKTAASPIERVKLLLQNQGELVKQGRLQTPYLGISDCFKRVLREEGVLALWRGNQANVIRYFPTQVLSLYLMFAGNGNLFPGFMICLMLVFGFCDLFDVNF